MRRIRNAVAGAAGAGLVALPNWVRAPQRLVRVITGSQTVISITSGLGGKAELGHGLINA